MVMPRWFPQWRGLFSMLLPPEAFRHVPALAGKIIEPEKSFFRLSRERMRELDRMARESGYPADWRLSDEAREATRKDAMAGHTGDLWLFAYGSLMWDPAVHVVEIRTGVLEGFHRRFCLKLQIGRGSADRPALMAGLDHGGECHGLALRIPAAQVETETEILWMREMLAGSYVPTFLAVATPQGPIDALAFVVNRQSDRYCEPDIDEAARLIATGRGVRGTSLEYLVNVAERLELVGLPDPAIETLLMRVRKVVEQRSQA
jgi:glutathione-specific gamma-glutamylcyclotransferase